MFLRTSSKTQRSYSEETPCISATSYLAATCPVYATSRERKKTGIFPGSHAVWRRVHSHHFHRWMYPPAQLRGSCVRHCVPVGSLLTSQKGDAGVQG